MAGLGLRHLCAGRGLRHAATQAAAYPRAAVAITVVRAAPGRQQLQFLLARRSNPPGAGSWSIPGGKLELGESTVAGGARELWEETGLESGTDVVISDSAYTTSDAIYWSDGQVEFHYLIAQLWARVLDPGAAERAQASSDVSALGWFTLEEVQSGDMVLGGNVAEVLQRLTATVHVDPSTRHVLPL